MPDECLCNVHGRFHGNHCFSRFGSRFGSRVHGKSYNFTVLLTVRFAGSREQGLKTFEDFATFQCWLPVLENRHEDFHEDFLEALQGPDFVILGT